MIKYVRLDEVKNHLKAGFSLIELMIVTGALSAVALLVMHLNKNMVDVKNDAVASNDYVNFRKEVDFLIENSHDCSVSVQGTPFRGSFIRTTLVPIDLWTADQKGQRSRKKFSGTDPLAKKSGKVTIESIGFTMPDYTAGIDFAAGKESFKGTILIQTSIQKNGKVKKMADIQKPIIVTFDTDAVGGSTLKFCGLVNFTSSVVNTGTLSVVAPSSTPSVIATPATSVAPASVSTPSMSTSIPVSIPTSIPTPTPTPTPNELSGVINGNIGEIKLPEGNLTVTLVAKYNYCFDERAILYFNGVNVGEAVGDGESTGGCAENVIMGTTTMTSNGGLYQVKLAPQNDKGPNSIQWFIVPSGI